MCGRVQAFEIEQSLWNLVNNTKRVSCGNPLKNVTSTSYCMLNLLALQIIEVDINFKGGCAFI
jgi:hypothetical protein